MTKYIIAIAGILVFHACRQSSTNPNDHNIHDHHDHSIHAHDEPNHTHANEHNHQDIEEHSLSYENQIHDPEKQTVIIIDNQYEAFIKFTPLAVDKHSKLNIYLTNLDNYKPVQSHKLSVKLIGKNTISKDAHTHEAGIFHARITPKNFGYHRLEIHFKYQNNMQVLTMDSIQVFKSTQHLHQDDNSIESLISYDKESAWNESFGIIKTEANTFSKVVKTSGKIMPAPGDETIITALHSGTISLKNTLIEGKKVTKGEAISIITSDLIHQNLTNDYLDAKNKFEKAKLNYNRAQKLVAEKLISEKDYLETKLNFESSKNYFTNISRFYSDGNENVNAPISGFIRTVFVSEGQFIEEGQPIASLVQNKKVILKANIPQQYSHLSSGFYTANFSPVYTNKLFSIKELNGERISVSSVLPENSFFTSVSFAFDANREIMPGSYAEVYLISANAKQCISIPRNALMEDQGNYFVFVMVDGEKYQKRYVKIGDSDGFNIEITSGLVENEYIVSQGVYQIYLASLGNAAPAHTHSH